MAEDPDTPPRQAHPIETAGQPDGGKDKAALDEKLKAILTSNQSSDAQVLDALSKGLQLGRKHVEDSRKAIAESKAAMAKADAKLEQRGIRR